MHDFTVCGKTHVLCQGTTLVGPKTARLMRALAPEVLLPARLPRLSRPAVERAVGS